MSKDYPCIYWDKGKCKKFSDDDITSWCVWNPCASQTPSNADRIRSMSDEELADLINREISYCAPTSGDCEKTSNDCKACWLDWLQQPAEEEAGNETD